MTSKLDEHFPGELQRWEYIRREADSELIVLKDDKDEVKLTAAAAVVYLSSLTKPATE